MRWKDEPIALKPKIRLSAWVKEVDSRGFVVKIKGRPSLKKIYGYLDGVVLLGGGRCPRKGI